MMLVLLPPALWGRSLMWRTGRPLRSTSPATAPRAASPLRTPQSSRSRKSLSRCACKIGPAADSLLAAPIRYIQVRQLVQASETSAKNQQRFAGTDQRFGWAALTTGRFVRFYRSVSEWARDLVPSPPCRDEYHRPREDSKTEQNQMHPVP
jgi:hypothetical protein